MLFILCPHPLHRLGVVNRAAPGRDTFDDTVHVICLDLKGSSLRHVYHGIFTAYRGNYYMDHIESERELERK